MSDVPTQPSSLPPELDQRLARIEAHVGQQLALLQAWADEAQALRARQHQAERELADARAEAKRLSERLARVERATELDGPKTEPAAAPPPEELDS